MNVKDLLKRKEKTQMERIVESLKDSLEGRTMYQKEDGVVIEDIEYVDDLLNDIEKANRIARDEREAAKLIKLPKFDLKLDSGVVAEVIRAGGSIVVALISYKFGMICLSYDKDGQIVPTRLFAFLRQLKK